MQKLSGLMLFAACATSFAASINPPFSVRPLKAFSAETHDGNKSSHIKLTLTGSDSLDDTEVRLGAVVICSDLACFQPVTPKAVNLTDTSGGKGSLIVDSDFPFGTVKSVYFEAVTGPKTVSGMIALPKPLKVERDYQGAEVMIALQKQVNPGSINFFPNAVATNLLRENGTSVYYDPKVATKASLPLGATLSIPAGATQSIMIFNVAAHDTGDEVALLDIYPQIDFLKAATVNFSPIQKPQSQAAELAAGRTPSPESMAPTGQSRPLGESPSNGTTTIQINATGVIRGKGIVHSSSLGQAQEAPKVTILAASDNQACHNVLSSAPNQTIITNSLSDSGTVRITWCESVAPYVHIGISNLADSREIFNITHSSVGGGGALQLQTITTWAQNTQVMVNGFTWSGDQGILGGTGYSDGYVESNGVVLGTNVSGGGNSTSGASGGPKYVMGIFPNKTVNWVTSTNPGTQAYNTASSSTSIVKMGVCATDSLSSAWSAVGTTPGGRLVFISSTSGTLTTAADLCVVFSALGVNNAIRLDGGPSTNPPNLSPSLAAPLDFFGGRPK